mmetsp:Transcript_783/g.1495  ORF Transcript_783/g.1495 Transcript_783/m.1495 type:complete len:171 (-) Transcript_783:31-543(-)
MSPSTPPLPPATGTMHYLFLSTTCLGFQGSNFFLHLHTLSLSTGRRLHTLAPLRIRIPKLSSFGCFSAPLYSWHTDFDAHIIARNNVSFTTIPFRSSRNNIPLTDNDYPKAVDDNCACFVVATKNAAAAPLNAGEAIRRGASNLPGYRSSDVFFSEFPLWSLPSPSPPSM